MQPLSILNMTNCVLCTGEEVTVQEKVLSNEMNYHLVKFVLWEKRMGCTQYQKKTF